MTGVASNPSDGNRSIRSRDRPRILLAPCGFKEGLTVLELIDCMAEGVARAAPEAEILRAPMVDGGEGFTRTLVELSGGSLHDVPVTGPVGQPLLASVGMLGGPHKGAAVIEIAAAAGLRHVPPSMRDPCTTTSYGVGQLIAAALDRNVERLLIGCGDSGVNDAGSGLAEALGVRLLDHAGTPIGRGGRALARCARIDMTSRDPRLENISIDVAVNWSNRLLGPDGVARKFGPQKGASPRDIADLELGLETFAATLERELGIHVRDMDGAGASGGLGAGLHAFVDAHLMPRFDVIARFMDFDALLSRADLVLTAEGQIDQLTVLGKMPAEIAKRAQRRGIPVIALVGAGAEATHAVGISAYFSVLNGPYSLEQALTRAPDLVSEATEQAVRCALIRCAG